MKSAALSSMYMKNVLGPYDVKARRFIRDIQGTALPEVD
jgi:hypothetical protein